MNSLKAIYAMALLIYSNLAIAQDPIELLKAAQVKCVAMQSGKIDLSESFKAGGETDTFVNPSTVTFYKAPDDSLCPYYFHSMTIEHDSVLFEQLYNGKEFVSASLKDSIGQVITGDKLNKRNRWQMLVVRVFHPFVDSAGRPLLIYKREDMENVKVEYLGKASYNNFNCHHIHMEMVPKPDSGDRTMILNLSFDFWINTLDTIPVAYNEVYQIDEGYGIETQYTLHEIFKYDFSREFDTSFFSRDRFQPYVTFQDYKPRKRLEQLAPGTKAPNWKYADLKGDTFELGKSTHKLLLLDFYFKDCKPCRDAFPYLQELHEKYKDQGLKVIGMNPIDKDLAILSEFLDTRGLTYQQLLTDKEICSIYGVDGYPIMYFIDQNGLVIKTKVGFGPTLGEEFMKEVEELLKGSGN